jgi:hypothetical protein
VTAIRTYPRRTPTSPPAQRRRPVTLRRRRRFRGPKHDLWVVPYADMMTLLFALFVVLYALGEIELSRLSELRRSIAFAFHYDGPPNGHTEPGMFEQGTSGGELIDGVELVNAQWGPMERFLHQTLVPEFEKVTGTSLEVVITDDSMDVTAPLDAFWDAGEVDVREDVQVWLVGLFEGIQAYAAETRVRVRVPDVAIGKDANGVQIRAEELCSRRLARLRELLRRIPAVDPRRVVSELALLPPSVEDWERAGRITFAFSNP